MAMIPTHMPSEFNRVRELFSRERFELEMSRLHPPFPMGTININGQFDRYFSPEIQAAWEGWTKGFLVTINYLNRRRHAANLVRQCESGLREGYPYGT